MSGADGAGHGFHKLREALAVDLVGPDTWRSRTVDPRGGRMFGGTTVAHLLAVAHSSASAGMLINSVSVNFVRSADGGVPCDYRVEHVFDGRSSAVRRVIATQHLQDVALADVTLRTPRPAWSHGDRRPSPDPESLTRTGMPHPARAIPDGAFDIRFQDCDENGTFVRRLWFRSIESVPGTAIFHQCVLALMSDLYFFEPIVAQHGYRADDPAVKYGTTQHTMWFHEAFRTDEWLLIESRSPVAAGGRGLVCGDIRTAEGVVVATVVQEVAIRILDSQQPLAPGAG